LIADGRRLAYNLNILALVCMQAPLYGALMVQLTGDLPCPLCLLERLGMFAVIIGLVMNVRLGIRPAHYGFSIAGAMTGMAIAGRHVLLHINDPPGGGYGGSVLGLHLYTWALIVFLCFLAGSAVLLMIPDGIDESGDDVNPRARWSGSRPARVVCYMAVLICVVNAVLALMECGLGQCPDNPTGYWIFGN
jgi:disulfide bond formation protein DsbB